MTNKQAIVTGAYGFLGRYTAKVFSENGYTVTGLGHGTWSRKEWEQWGLLEWHSCDINLQSIRTYAQSPDVIIHCAGSGSVGYSLIHPMQDFERTVVTTISILEYIRMYSPNTRFIYPSSAAVYGSVNQLPISELTPLNPISPYGIHKKIVEEICQSYANFFKISVAIARFFSIYGPTLQKQLLWDTCCKIKSRDLNFYGSGEEIRDWIYVTDAARLLFLLSSLELPSPAIVNGGSGIGKSVRDIIQLIIEKMEISATPQFSDKEKTGDPQNYIADIKTIRGYGWEPKISLLEGIDSYVRWYKSGVP